LEDKFARDGAAGGESGGNSLNKLVNRARDMAGHLQSKLTGQQTASKARLNLRLSGAGGDQEQNEIHRAPGTQKHRPGDVAGQFKQDHRESDREFDLPGENDSRRPNSEPSPGAYGEPGAQVSSDNDNPANHDHS